MDAFPLFFEKLAQNHKVRVLSDFKSSKKFSLDAFRQALKINLFLKRINSKNKQVNLNWKCDWLKKSGLKTKQAGVKEWFSGRASIPLKAVLALNSFCDGKEFNLVKENCTYFCTKTSSPTFIPHEINPKLAWLVAAILCDGHLRKNAESVVFEVGDVFLVQKFRKCIVSVFKINCVQPRLVNRNERKLTFSLDLHNKPICYFFNQFFGIPFGKKSSIIRVPDLIFDSNIEIKKEFLKGVFDTDGGKRGHGLGLTSLSEKFIGDVALLLKEFEINAYTESWLNKKYNKKCFGLRFKIDAHSMFLLRQSEANAKC